MVKNSPAEVGDAGDTGLSPGLGKSLGEGNGNPLQYYCSGNPVDRGASRATVQVVAGSQMQLNTHVCPQNRGDMRPRISKSGLRYHIPSLKLENRKLHNY